MDTTRPMRAIGIIFIILAFSVPALAQNAYRVDPTPVMTTNSACQPGAQCPALFVPGTTIQVCNYPNCTSPVLTYTDSTLLTACPSFAPVTLPGSTLCQSTVGSRGQFGFWVQQGLFAYKAILPNGTVQGPFPFTGGTVSSGIPVPLILLGAGAFPGGELLQIKDTSGAPGIAFGTATNTTGYLLSGATLAQAFANGVGTINFAIKQNGFVGIGQQNPTDKLQIDGGGININGSTFTDVSRNTSVNNLVVTGTCTGCGGGTPVVPLILTGTSTGLANELLQINDASGGPTITFRNGGTNYGYIGAGATLSTVFVNGAGTVVGGFKQNGNFGINNTNPADKLEIDGGGININGNPLTDVNRNTTVNNLTILGTCTGACGGGGGGTPNIVISHTFTGTQEVAYQHNLNTLNPVYSCQDHASPFTGYAPGENITTPATLNITYLTATAITLDCAFNNSGGGGGGTIPVPLIITGTSTGLTDELLQINDTSGGPTIWFRNGATNYGYIGSGATLSQVFVNGAGTVVAGIKQNGNVGIGNTNPTDKLQIDGGGININGTNFTDVNRNTNVNNLNITGTCTGCIGSVPVPLIITGTSTGLTDELLQINDLGGGPTIWFRNASTNYGYISAGASLSQAFVNGAGTVVAAIKQNGNFGIGTTNPADKLEIDGGGINIAGSAFTDVSRNTSVNNLTVAGTCTGCGSVSVPLIITGTSTGLTDELLQINDLGGGPTIWFRNASTNYGYISAGASLSQAFVNGAGTVVAAIKQNGNVGIGNTNPLDKLDILGGGIRVGGNAFTDVGRNVSASSIAIGGNPFTDVNRNTVVNNLTINGSCTGCAAFTVPLILSGSTTFPAEVLQLRDTGGTPGISFNNGSVFTGWIESGAPGAFDMVNATGVIMMRLLQNGNVGINNTSPADKLEIDGGGININGSTFTDVSRNTSVNNLTVSGTCTGCGTVAVPLILTGTTTFPAELLQIHDSSGAPGIQFNNGSINTGWIDSGATAAFAFVSSSASIVMTMLQGGNVGINNTGPADKLDILGGGIRIGGSQFTDGSRNTTVANMSVGGTCTGCVKSWNGRDGVVSMSNFDITAAAGQDLSSAGAPGFTGLTASRSSGTAGTFSTTFTGSGTSLTLNLNLIDPTNSAPGIRFQGAGGTFLASLSAGSTNAISFSGNAGTSLGAILQTGVIQATTGFRVGASAGITGGSCSSFVGGICVAP